MARWSAPVGAKLRRPPILAGIPNFYGIGGRGLEGLMTRSGGIVLSEGNKVIENKIIFASGTGIKGTSLANVVLRGNLIIYNRARSAGKARGIDLLNCDDHIVEGNEVIHYAAPAKGPLISTSQSCIYIEGGSNSRVLDNTTRGGSTGVQYVAVDTTYTRYHENHDARGPYPRGQAIQFNSCTGSHIVLEPSDESIPGTSWNEDNINIYNTPNVHVLRLFVPMMSDGLSGRGSVMELEGTINCTIEDAEFRYLFNGAGGGFQVGAGNRYIGAKVKDWNLYSVRALPGSSNDGTTLPAMFVTAFNPVAGVYTEIQAIYDSLPGRTPDGGSLDAWEHNIWYNPTDVGGIAQGFGTVTQQAWSSTRRPNRNPFPWRPTNAPPSLIAPPRINSNWLDNQIGTTLIAGTSILAGLPGRYMHDPIERRFQWWRDGVAITGQTGINYETLLSDSGKQIDWAETPVNDNGEITVFAGRVAIP